MIYWNHRLFHVPFFYKNFHKLHHSYKAPTAFSVTAIHPVECAFFQTLYMLPMFTIPVHWGECTSAVEIL
jgi:lathosterol oxidase